MEGLRRSFIKTFCFGGKILCQENMKGKHSRREIVIIKYVTRKKISPRIKGPAKPSHLVNFENVWNVSNDIINVFYHNTHICNSESSRTQTEEAGMDCTFVKF